MLVSSSPRIVHFRVSNPGSLWDGACADRAAGLQSVCRHRPAGIGRCQSNIPDSKVQSGTVPYPFQDMPFENEGKGHAFPLLKFLVIL